ncbi:predicted protein [Ostreococcus lucimarinus CCE9901]|uniref:Uncharacterized protein n=1 Tax=Ostreococcus lucimarinus (strain CCE9901) TaxID=436017 RepID=A4S184_OSTLU|nr:predicted protein [Ostreococcus lucimarinus CCE9901]ABO97397.1 predicted protein [Ostreococcus lucimarinus CCE9901]|eukprot:XP_001419104.1 predicted protein [Ostreococcus lucimarinus CCE9901]
MAIVSVYSAQPTFVKSCLGSSQPKGSANKLPSSAIPNSDRVTNIDGTTASHLYEVMNTNGEESAKKKTTKFIKWMKAKGIELETIRSISATAFTHASIRPSISNALRSEMCPRRRRSSMMAIIFDAQHPTRAL